VAVDTGDRGKGFLPEDASQPIAQQVAQRRADGGRAEGSNLPPMDATDNGIGARSPSVVRSPFASPPPQIPSPIPSLDPSARARFAGFPTFDNGLAWVPGTMQSVRSHARR